MPVPPVGWSPMYFGEDLIFNQICFEAPDTDPAWTGHLRDARPTARRTTSPGCSEGDETLRDRARPPQRARVPPADLRCRCARRSRPRTSTAACTASRGEAIATAPMPAWPNVSFHDSVYRWEDEQGRVAHATYQEIWFDTLPACA